ncbi:MAG: hypothetical protein ABIL62_11740, partial [Planctomycetota bacterium]
PRERSRLFGLDGSGDSIKMSLIDGLRVFKKRATQMTIVCEEAVKGSLGKNAQENEEDNSLFR